MMSTRPFATPDSAKDPCLAQTGVASGPAGPLLLQAQEGAGAFIELHNAMASYDGKLLYLQRLLQAANLPVTAPADRANRRG